MDRIVDFMQAFILKENEAAVARLTERDDVFEDKLAELRQFYAAGTRPDIHRPSGKDDRWFEQAKDELPSVKPRVLFQVKEYNHADLGNLYRSYTSDYICVTNKANYFANFFVAHTDEGLKIVAKYTKCRTCDGTGDVDGKPCRDCTFDGWTHSDGIEFTSLGQFVEVRKLRAPDRPNQRAAYESDE